MDEKAERVADRLSDTVEGLRDRTADIVRADGGSVFRELGKLGKRVDERSDEMTAHISASEAHVLDRIDESEAGLSARIDKLVAQARRTSTPRRLFWLAVGAAVGVAVAYLGDPDQGRTRRAKLNDQAGARGRDAASQVAKKAKGAAGRAKGEIIEQVKDTLPEDVPVEPALLEQRIKSDVFGHRSDTAKVVLRIDGPGAVALKGTVPTLTSERELLAAVAEVEGVTGVISELTVSPT